MKVYALDVRNVELDKRFYNNLTAMGFNLKGQWGHRLPFTDDCHPETYWLFFDEHKRYLSFLHESDVADEGYGADLEGATEYILRLTEPHKRIDDALVEEFNWRKADVYCIDLGQLM